VDTPETFIPNQPNEYGNITDLDCLDKWGDKATAFSERHLGVETSVILHFDGDKKEDVYGRTLAYIHLPDDLDFNKGLIRNGLARVYEKGSSHRELDYKNSQVLAIEAEVGLWQCGNE
jgi:endonuclease YncB( thermonuclease family)